MIGNIFNSDYLIENSHFEGISVKHDSIEYDYYTETLSFLINADREFTNAKIELYKEAAKTGDTSIISEGVISAIGKMVNSFINFIKSLFSKTSASSSSSDKDGKKISKFELLEKAINDKNKNATISFEGFYYKTSEADIKSAINKINDKNLSNAEIKSTMFSSLRSNESEPTQIKMSMAQVKDYVKNYEEVIKYDIKATEDRAIKEIQNDPAIKEGKSEEEVKKIINKASICFSQVAIAVVEYGKTVDKVIALVKEAGKKEKKED